MRNAFDDSNAESEIDVKSAVLQQWKNKVKL